MTVEQRLAEIEDLGYASYDDTRWLLSLVRSMHAVVEAAEEAQIALVEALNLIDELSRAVPGVVATRYSHRGVADAQVNVSAALEAYRRESEGQ